MIVENENKLLYLVICASQTELFDALDESHLAMVMKDGIEY